MLFIALVGGRGTGLYTCRRCGARIASEADAVRVSGRPERASYTNPYGHTFEILTVAVAENVIGADEATFENTWFEGYAWRPIVCAMCKSHLGWKYEGDDAFYGLLTTELRIA